MGEIHVGENSEKEKEIGWCPICGNQLPKSATKGLPDSCPSCGFKVVLLTSPRGIPLPPNTPPYIPAFTFAILLIQCIIAGVLGVAFLILAHPYYGGLPLVIVIMQFLSIPTFGIVIVLLRRKKVLLAVRITLIVLGVITLPVGILAMAAGLSITPAQKWCVVCKNAVKWGTSSLECPNCQAIFHRWGRCRQLRYQIISNKLDYEPAIEEFENLCPQCQKPLTEQRLEGADHG